MHELPTDDNSRLQTLSESLNLILSHCDYSEALSAALSMRDEQSGASLWKKNSSARFLVDYRNRCGGTICYETVNGCDKQEIFGAKYDAVRYKSQGQDRTGIVYFILAERKSSPQKKLVVIKRLKIVAAHPDNYRPVREFGHIRMGFDCNDDLRGDVILDVVPVSALVRTTHIVPDYHDIASRYTIATRAHEVLGTVEERRVARFFEVLGVQVTAVLEAEI